MVLNRRRQSLVCGVTSAFLLLTLYTYGTLYTFQWDTRTSQAIIFTGVKFLVNSHPENSEKDLVTSRDDAVSTSSNESINPSSTASTTVTKKHKKLYLMDEDEYERVKEIHKRRRLHINKSCKKFLLTKSNTIVELMANSGGDYYRLRRKPALPQSPYSSNFQVDWPDEVLFCWQYKVGSTAWNAMFAHLLNETRILKYKNFYDMRQIMLVTDTEKLQKAAAKFYRFMIVRDPFVRLLSAYRDRIEDTTQRSWQREHFGPKILALNRPNLKESQMRVNGSLSVIPTFSEFVKFLLATPLNNFDPHWAPYWKHCVPCAMNYHAVGRSETQEQDIRFILEDSGLAKKVDIKILEENAHEGRGKTSDLMVTYYSTLSFRDLERLYRKYEVDYLLFGYDVQLLLNELYPGKNISFPSSFK